MDDFMAKVTTSATMLLTGFTVVFSVLLLLILIIYVYGTIMYKLQNRDKTKKDKKQPQTEEKPVTKMPAVQAAPVASSDEIPGEIVSVIAAAVDSMYGDASGKVRIKNIKKSGGRSPWANAGVLDNTRPF